MLGLESRNNILDIIQPIFIIIIILLSDRLQIRQRFEMCIRIRIKFFSEYLCVLTETWIKVTTYFLVSRENGR